MAHAGGASSSLHTKPHPQPLCAHSRYWKPQIPPMVTPKESRRDAQTVQITHSELQLISSDVHWFSMTAMHKDPAAVAEKQPVMCDFEIVKDEQNPARFYVTLLLELEDQRRTEGLLQFSISTVSVLEFRKLADPTPLPVDEDARWNLFYNGLSAAISTARGYLTNYLAPTTYRGYLLPMLDVKALVNRKYVRPSLPAVPSTAESEKPTSRAKK